MQQGGGTAPISDNNLIYSIQRTYIIKPVFKPDNLIFTCDERIDIPTIEPLKYVDPVVYPEHRPTVVPCIEITTTLLDLDGINLTFETNEGVTVLPVKIASGTQNPLENPYLPSRYVLVLPRGATGVKSCRLIKTATGEEFQHNFTFGVMPPPYNYDNALFGVITSAVSVLADKVGDLETKTNNLKIVADGRNASYPYKNLPKGSGKQTVKIEKGMLYFGTNFTYLSVPQTVHSPKITVSDGITTNVYTLSLDKSVRVIIDLLADTLTAYDTNTGEIVQQRKIFETVVGYKSIDYENFDDILGNEITVLIGGRSVE